MLSISLKGALFILLTIIFWGIPPILDKIATSKVDAIAALFIRGIAILCGAILLLTLTGKWKTIGEMSIKSAISLATSGFIAGCLGVFTYFRALQEVYDSGKVVMMTSTYPLIALLLGIMLLNEPVSLSKIIGSFAIMFGIILLNL